MTFGFERADVQADAADDRVVRQAVAGQLRPGLAAVVVLQMPLPGPPPLKPHGCRRR